MHKTLAALTAFLVMSSLPISTVCADDHTAESVDNTTIGTPTPDPVPVPHKVTKKDHMSRADMKAADEATLNALKESASKLTDAHHKTMSDIGIAHLEAAVKAYDSFGDEDFKWLSMIHAIVTHETRKLNSLFKGEASYIQKAQRKAEKEAAKAAPATETPATEATPAPEGEAPKGIIAKVADSVSAATTAVVNAVKPAEKPAEAATTPASESTNATQHNATADTQATPATSEAGGQSQAPATTPTGDQNTNHNAQAA